jgi:GT2 family glycosyltransferase
MAVLNGERHLREAIDSILRQTFTSFELIVVDDGSTDGTAAILQSYVDPRLRVLTNTVNQGLSRSLNAGIALARGRYIARLDADDVAHPERLAKQVDFIERYPDVSLLGAWCTLVDDDGRRIGERRGPCTDAEIRWTLQFCTPFAHSSVMFRRPSGSAGGPYDESLVYAMDYDLWSRLAAAGRAACLDELLVCWRASNGSMTSRLGDRTERFERVVAALTAQLGWSPADRADNERRTDILCGIVAGTPPDITLDEAAWATRTLSVLLEDLCRRERFGAAAEQWLRTAVRRDTARALLWVGHRYPDRHDHRYSRGALRAAVRLDPRSLLTRAGVTLALKLIGGRPMVAAVRRSTSHQWH